MIFPVSFLLILKFIALSIFYFAFIFPNVCILFDYLILLCTFYNAFIFFLCRCFLLPIYFLLFFSFMTMFLCEPL